MSGASDMLDRLLGLDDELSPSIAATPPANIDGECSTARSTGSRGTAATTPPVTDARSRVTADNTPAVRLHQGDVVDLAAEPTTERT